MFNHDVDPLTVLNLLNTQCCCCSSDNNIIIYNSKGIGRRSDGCNVYYLYIYKPQVHNLR